MTYFMHVYSIAILTLFITLSSTNCNTFKRNVYINCLKRSIKSCKVETLAQRRKITKSCKIIVLHNQNIDQIDNFYNCKRKSF